MGLHAPSHSTPAPGHSITHASLHRPPADTLAWKLELLREGSAAVEPLLPRIPQRAFVLVGDQDLLLPSGEEGPRLQRALPRAQLRVEQGRSHALLQVSRLRSLWGGGSPCAGGCLPCVAGPRSHPTPAL